ncbi:MAG: hypothetical protein KC561_21195, partial [Myxococcales bacterium]|nr:hypothetical protein [Myxococcales bacterium]
MSDLSKGIRTLQDLVELANSTTMKDVTAAAAAVLRWQELEDDPTPLVAALQAQLVAKHREPIMNRKTRRFASAEALARLATLGANQVDLRSLLTHSDSAVREGAILALARRPKSVPSALR